MKWAVEIQKTSLERRNLEDLLNGLGFALIEGIQFPAFTSLEIDDCDTAAAVFEKAKLIRAGFTGPAQIDPDFALGSVIDYSFDPPRRHAFLEVQSAIMKHSVGTVTLKVLPPKDLSNDELKIWEDEHSEMDYQAKLEQQRSKLEPAYRNPRAAKVLELLSIENPSAEIIYKIYELAEGHPNNRAAFHAQFGVSKAQFDRFRDAVHNPMVTGDWARHAYEELPKTKNPMSKGEAEQFVRKIASEWLKYVRASGIK
jgi:hypothetical protein